MTTPLPRSFEARLDQFPELRGYAEHWCLEAGFERAATDRLILVLEELFANTVEHGYSRSRIAAPPGSRLVWLTLVAAMERIEAVYEDAAPRHNPFAGAADPDYTGSHYSWKVGGLGVSLVIKLGNEVRYERAEGRNRIFFAILAPRAAG
jgi:serine/threonine-protein kinase RsbW